MNTIGTGPRTHYDVLEVSQAASPQVLRAAYKSLIQRYHPDRNPGDASAAERSTLVVNAYQVLSDPVARAAYDRELKRQANGLQGLHSRRSNQADSAPLHSATKKYRWVFWAPVFLLAVFLWFLWSALSHTPPLTIETKTIAAPRDTPPQKGSDGNAIRATRAVPDFIENLSVDLVPPPLPEDARPADATRILSIRTIGLVAGGFDPDKFIECLKANQDYIARKLSQRLANADYERLISKDGDHYLKQLILDSISEITNTNRIERNTPAGKASATHYGAVEVLLPDAYSVESRNGSQVTIQRRGAQP